MCQFVRSLILVCTCRSLYLQHIANCQCCRCVCCCCSAGGPCSVCWHSHCTSCCECVPEEEQTEKVISLAHDGRVDDGDHIQQLIVMHYKGIRFDCTFVIIHYSTFVSLSSSIGKLYIFVVQGSVLVHYTH